MFLNKLNITLICIILVILFMTCMHKIYNIEGFANNNNNGIIIPAILYINLANRTDRKKQILDELDKLKLDNTKTRVQRIDAVYMPKNGHKGCVQSHIKALNTIKATPGLPYALILEDDFELAVSPSEFNSQVAKIIATLENRHQSWDIIMLATAYATKEPLVDDIVRVRKSTTSSAYIIKRAYIDTLLECFMECDSHMSADKVKDPKNGFEDYALDQQWAKLQKRDNWFGFSKDLSKQREVWSSIQTGVHENIRLTSDQNTAK